MSSLPGVQLPEASPQQVTPTLDNISLEVMSPTAMAYLLEVISADISKAEDMERCRRNSGTKSRLPSIEVFSPDSVASVLAQSSALVDTTAVDTRPTLSYSQIAHAAKNIVAAASTLADVTNAPPQLEIIGDHNGNISKIAPSPSATVTKTTSQRKRPAMEEEDNEENTDEVVEMRRSKKKSRSSTSDEENARPPVTRRKSSTRSVPSPKPINPQSELSCAPSTINPTNDTTPETSSLDEVAGKSKKSRSRRFKDDELSFLDAVYKTEPYPDPMITERLSIQLDVSEHRIKVWFANRRHRQAREREQKMTNLTEKKNQLITETAALPAESSHTPSALPTSPSTLASSMSAFPFPNKPPTLPNTPSAFPNTPSAYPRTPSAFHSTVTPTFPNSSSPFNGSTYQFPGSPSFVPTPPPHGFIPSGYSYVHPSTIPSAVPRHAPDFSSFSAEAHMRAQIASTIQSRFPFSSPALLQLANQTMLSRSGLNPSAPGLLQLANQTMLSAASMPGTKPSQSNAYPMGQQSGTANVSPVGGDPSDLPRMPRRPSSSSPSYYIEPPILPPLPAESTSYTDGESLSPAIEERPSPWHWMP